VQYCVCLKFAVGYDSFGPVQDRIFHMKRQKPLSLRGAQVSTV